MRVKEKLVYLFWFVLTEAVGILAAILTRNQTMIYVSGINKPYLAPPAFIFPIVWSILYGLMAISIARITLLPKSSQRQKAIQIYSVQLIINFLWSFLFFNLRLFGFSFYWLVLLWVFIFWMIVVFKELDSVAAYLLIPYLLWVSFAGYLNYMIWLLN